MRILILITLSALFAVAAPAQTLMGNCGVNQITGIHVLSDLSIDVYCMAVPSSCADTLNFAVACNSQYIPAVM